MVDESVEMPESQTFSGKKNLDSMKICEADERRIEKRKQNCERNLAKFSIQRLNPLGRDRNHSVYWFFDLIDMNVPSGRIFVEAVDGSWIFYNEPEQVGCFSK